MHPSSHTVIPVEQETTLDKGIRRFEEIMNIPAEKFLGKFASVAPDFGKYILEWEFGEMYGREGIDLRTREIVIIASCATLGAVGLPALKMHIAAALRLGISRQEIGEILMQVAFSAGLPTAISALEAALEVFESVGASMASAHEGQVQSRAE